MMSVQDWEHSSVGSICRVRREAQLDPHKSGAVVLAPERWRQENQKSRSLQLLEELKASLSQTKQTDENPGARPGSAAC